MLNKIFGIPYLKEIVEFFSTEVFDDEHIGPSPVEQFDRDGLRPTNQC